jgi:hypothetical protein
VKCLRPPRVSPDALFRLVPAFGQPVQQSADLPPAAVADGQTSPVGEEETVHGLAVDVELQLVRGAVADPDGLRTPVTRPALQALLLEVGRPVHPVHDLQPVMVVGPLGDPVPQPQGEPHRLRQEADTKQRGNRQRGIAHPGVPVVPVPLAADLLGQAGGGRGDQPPGGGVGHELQRDGRP